MVLQDCLSHLNKPISKFGVKWSYIILRRMNLMSLQQDYFHFYEPMLGGIIKIITVQTRPKHIYVYSFFLHFFHYLRFFKLFYDETCMFFHVVICVKTLTL